nr:hypothetical protein [Helicobacter acinonychis]
MLIVVSALSKKAVAVKRNKIRFKLNSYIHHRNKNRYCFSSSPLLKSSFVYKTHLECKLFQSS